MDDEHLSIDMDMDMENNDMDDDKLCAISNGWRHFIWYSLSFSRDHETLSDEEVREMCEDEEEGMLNCIEFNALNN